MDTSDIFGSNFRNTITTRMRTRGDTKKKDDVTTTVNNNNVIDTTTTPISWCIITDESSVVHEATLRTTVDKFLPTIFQCLSVTKGIWIIDEDTPTIHHHLKRPRHYSAQFVKLMNWTVMVHTRKEDNSSSSSNPLYYPQNNETYVIVKQQREQNHHNNNVIPISNLAVINRLCQYYNEYSTTTATTITTTDNSVSNNNVTISTNTNATNDNEKAGITSNDNCNNKNKTKNNFLVQIGILNVAKSENMDLNWGNNHPSLSLHRKELEVRNRTVVSIIQEPFEELYGDDHHFKSMALWISSLHILILPLGVAVQSRHSYLAEAIPFLQPNTTIILVPSFYNNQIILNNPTIRQEQIDAVHEIQNTLAPFVRSVGSYIQYYPSTTTTILTDNHDTTSTTDDDTAAALFLTQFYETPLTMSGLSEFVFDIMRKQYYLTTTPSSSASSLSDTNDHLSSVPSVVVPSMLRNNRFPLLLVEHGLQDFPYKKCLWCVLSNNSSWPGVRQWGWSKSIAHAGEALFPCLYRLLHRNTTEYPRCGFWIMDNLDRDGPHPWAQTLLKGCKLHHAHPIAILVTTNETTANHEIMEYEYPPIEDGEYYNHQFQEQYWYGKGSNQVFTDFVFPEEAKKNRGRTNNAAAAAAAAALLEYDDQHLRIGIIDRRVEYKRAIRGVQELKLALEHINVVSSNTTTSATAADTTTTTNSSSIIVSLEYFESPTSLNYQASWFHSQHIIVAVHGAALTNAVFMVPETTVLQIYPFRYYFKGYYESLINATGGYNMEYYDGNVDQAPKTIIGQRDSTTRKNIKYVNISIPDIIEQLTSVAIPRYLSKNKRGGVRFQPRRIFK